MSIYLSPIEYLKEIIGGFYLETGFIDTLGIATCSEEVFKPAVLRLSGTEVMNGYADYIAPNFVGETLVDGQESKSLTCSTKLATVTDTCSNVYSNGNYCTFEQMQTRKFDREHVQPGVFPGKMKLFIQSLYGSVREDYEAVKLALGGRDRRKLSVNSFILDPERSNDNWCLYTTSSYEYYLVSIETGVLRYTKLTLSAIAEEWAAILATHPSNTDRTFTDKVEAYILSTAVPDQEIISTAYTGPSHSGWTLTYGWQQNWNGSELSIVKQQPYMMNGQLPGDSWIEGWAYQAHHFKAVITDNQGVLSCTVSDSPKGTPWNPKNQCMIVWYADFYAGGMKAFAEAGVVNEKYVGPHSDAALVCWYEDDIIKFVTSTDDRIRREASVDNSPVDMPDSTRIFKGSGKSLKTYIYNNPAAFIGQTSIDAAGQNYTRDVTIDGSLTEVFAEVIPGVGGSIGTTEARTANLIHRNDWLIERTTRVATWAMSTGLFEPDPYFPGEATSIANPDGSFYRIRQVAATGIRLTGRRTAGWKLRHGVYSIEIPFDSCDSVIVGDMNKESTPSEDTLSDDYLYPSYVYPLGFEILNSGDNSLVIRSPGAAKMGSPDAVPGNIPPAAGNIPAYDNVPISTDAVIKSSKYHIDDDTGVYNFYSTRYYIDWAFGPWDLSSYDTVRNTLNSQYLVEFNAESVIENNGFLGNYAVGYS